MKKDGKEAKVLQSKDAFQIIKRHHLFDACGVYVISG